MEPYYYNDSISYELQAGYSGINASVTRQYKRRLGQTLKNAFIEQWAMVPDPDLLWNLYGLEVSMCTYNSRTVQLSELLSKSCMRLFLESKSFDWGTEVSEQEYYVELNANSKQKWKVDPVFRKVFNSAVMLSLNFLRETDVNHRNDL